MRLELHKVKNSVLFFVIKRYCLKLTIKYMLCILSWSDDLVDLIEVYMRMSECACVRACVYVYVSKQRQRLWVVTASWFTNNK